MFAKFLGSGAWGGSTDLTAQTGLTSSPSTWRQGCGWSGWGRRGFPPAPPQLRSLPRQGMGRVLPPGIPPGGVPCLALRQDACNLALAATMTAMAAAVPVINDRWKRSLPWVLKTDALIPAAVYVLGCAAFQHHFLVLLCTRASYVINGHGGVVSPAWASALLSSGTTLACASA